MMHRPQRWPGECECGSAFPVIGREAHEKAAGQAAMLGSIE